MPDRYHPSDPTQDREPTFFSMEYREDTLRDLFSSHFAGLAGLVILDRISDGETIIIRKRDGISVALADRGEAHAFLCNALGWTPPTPK
jgi:hypothetical protein